MEGFDIVAELEAEDFNKDGYGVVDMVAKDIGDVDDLTVVREVYGKQYLARPVEDD